MPRARPVEPHDGCYTHGLKPKPDATALCRGGSRLELNSSKRENSTVQGRGICSPGFGSV